MAMKERTGRSRVSKADQVVNKINPPAQTVSSGPARIRPTSKADGISKKIPGSSAAAVPTRVRPSSKADEISRKIPSPKPASNPRPIDPIPQQASSRVVPPAPVSKPTAKKRSGCCLLPFTLAIAAIAAALIIIF
ncbi:MAG: hypothetical protein IJI57_16640 [Flexilinea sp.]|nr:hypothetical protein [Flexilinea sp.]